MGGNSAEDIYTAQKEGLPNISGSTNPAWTNQTETLGKGAFYVDDSLSNRIVEVAGYNNASKAFNFDASRSNAIYGASEHVTPENYAVYWFIKAKKEE